MTERYRPEGVTMGTPDNEKRLFEMSAPSGISWQEGVRLISFPRVLSGLRSLDIGAGASDLVCKLLEEDADAYAVDPAYLNMSGLIEQVKLANMLLKLRYGDIYKPRDTALERFIRSSKEQPTRYKQAFASSLPFEDNYFNLVYSINSIFPYVDADPQLAIRVIKECLRVTKPGGMIQLFPFEGKVDFGQGQEILKLRTVSHLRLSEWIRSNPRVGYSITRVGKANDRKLTLVKKKVDIN